MVHSPDGEDCGVVNQMTISTLISSFQPNGCPGDQKLKAIIIDALPSLKSRTNSSLDDRLVGTVPVWVDGKVIGYVTAAKAQQAEVQLRKSKCIAAAAVSASGMVPHTNIASVHTMEVVCIPPGSRDPAGLFIFTGSGRLMRPVCDLSTANGMALVYIGTWEQSWLDIASVAADLVDAHTQLNRTFRYMEQSGNNVISLTSATIPFFEYNCSPRNLFQCGLSKQTAGTQLLAQSWRREAKLFRMYTPQRYIVRTLPMDYFGLDDVALGVNAVVAILSYTGYDLDDAVIVNHTSVQRGMFHAGVTIAKVVNAAPKSTTDDAAGVVVFNNILPGGGRFCPELHENGLPPLRNSVQGATFQRDHSQPALLDSSPVYSTAKRFTRVDAASGKNVHEYTRHHVVRWRQFDKGEAAWVHSVVPLKYSGADVVSALIVFRIPRNPTVGDKFSSRHGQKGTLPLQIQGIDLPFTSKGGMIPDVVINPHAFPSRMTVGMVLEIIGAKLGAIQGRFCDFSAWSTVDDEPVLAESIGNGLVASGFHRYGRETLICGISGEQMDADVFMGISGYQRLRHMVNDKWQSRARTDAHVHRAVTKTSQPVKGRKRHGGVRVGEMERDGLLSHGISEVVLDRLLHVSDKTKAFICTNCGGFQSIYERHTTKFSSWKSCKFCFAGLDEASDTIKMIDVPQVFRLWVTELASAGVRVALLVN